MRTMRNTVAEQIAMKAVVQFTLIATTGKRFSGQSFAIFTVLVKKEDETGNLLYLGPADLGYMNEA